MAANNLSASSGAGHESQPVVATAPKGLGLVASVALLLMALIAATSLGFAAGRLTAPVASAAASATDGSAQACWGYRTGAGWGIACMDEDGPGWMGGRPGGMPGLQQGGIYGSGYASVVSGSVKAVDVSSLTIELAGGRSMAIGLNGKTRYRVAGASGAAGAADVKIGATVTIGLIRSKTPTAGLVVIQNR